MKMSLNKKYFKKYERETNYEHEQVPVSYQTFKIGDKKYFQIDTYTRKTNIETIGPTIQSNHKLQFDKETAIEFINLLKKEFEIK